MKKLKVLSRERLNSEQSEKEVYHIALENKYLEYEVGDVLRIYPENMPHLVEHINKLYNNLDISSLDLRNPSKKLIEKLSKREESLKELLNPINFVKMRKFILENTVPELIEKYGLIEESELLDSLNEIRPRAYSIASSMKAFPKELHLTVAMNKFNTNKGEEKGTASSFLIDSLSVNSELIGLIGKKEHFKLPDSDKDIIMIGPGTGIAPFIGFMQERLECKGKNLLFFGERNEEHDFYYKDFLKELEKQGHLTLELAFSRDQEEKIYVQHKMLENEEKIKEMIDKGAYIYICGDAKKMAKDVEITFKNILNKKEDSPCELSKLKDQKRYITDVY